MSNSQRRRDRDRDESLIMDEEEPTPRPPPGYFYTIKKYDGIEIMCPMQFAIYPSFDFVEDVVELIEDGCGEVKLFDENDDKMEHRPDYLINLINFKAIAKTKNFKDEYLPNDGYNIEFIRDFYNNPATTDLREYSVNKSNYKLQRHNINDILFQRVSWNDIVRLKHPNPREPIKPLLNIYHAQLVHNYDSSQTQSQNENSTSTGQNDSNNKEQEDNQEESDQIEQVELEVESDMNEEINQENGKEHPPENNVNNGKTVITYYTEVFCPPKKKKYKGPPKVITNNAWVNLTKNKAEDDDEEEDDVEYISASPPTKTKQQDKPPLVSAPFLRPTTTSPRRTSPRKKANQEEDEPIAGHSRNLIRSDELAQFLRSKPQPQQYGTGKNKRKNSENIDNSSDTPAKRSNIDSPPDKENENREEEQVTKTTTTKMAGKGKDSTELTLTRRRSERTKKKFVDDSDDDENESNGNTPGKNRQQIPSSSSSSDKNKSLRPRRPSMNSEISLDIDDLDIDDLSYDSAPARAPPQQQRPASRGSNSSRGQVDRGGRRPGTKQILWKPTHSQSMLDLVLEKKWGHSVKGYEMWKYIEKKKLLDSKVGGHRSFQSLHAHFKNTILPKLERMISGDNSTSLKISPANLKYMKNALKSTANNPHHRRFVP